MHDDESGTCGQWGEYGQLLDPDVLLGGLVGDDAGHEKPGLLPDLGVQVGADSDDVVRLPMVECDPVIVCLRAFGHGDAPGGGREARGLVSRAFAPPPAVDAYLSVRVSGRTRMSWLSGVAGRAACR